MNNVLVELNLEINYKDFWEIIQKMIELVDLSDVT